MSAKQMPYTVVCCSEFADPQWRWIEQGFDPSYISFEFVRCVPRYKFEQNKWLNLARIRGCYFAVRLARKINARAIVTHGPTLAAWCCVFGALTRLKIPLLAHSFNFSKAPNGIKRRFFSILLRRADSFVVFSTMERELYAHTFHLPRDRFSVVLWSVNRPKVGHLGSPLQLGAYVSAIGGNARDYRTLLSAAAELPHIQFVLVVRPESLRGLIVPQNVLTFQNLPDGLAMNVLFYSRFMVLPLADFNIPSGHVTLVAAMHLGKAVIVTDALGVRDYIRNGENAVTVPVASVVDLVIKISQLWNDTEFCARLGESGQHFAARECSEECITRHFRDWLVAKRLASELEGADVDHDLNGQ
jgi:glycosyltransferase involved in cell wall biosynthesis